jgi:hypothetical protein
VIWKPVLVYIKLCATIGFINRWICNCIVEWLANDTRSARQTLHQNSCICCELYEYVSCFELRQVVCFRNDLKVFYIARPMLNVTHTLRVTSQQ